MSASDGPGRDVVCFAGQDWWYHNQAHSDFQLVRRIAERRTVLVVNSIGLRMPLPGRSTQFVRRLGRKLRSLTRLARRPDPLRPGFIVYSPWILPFYSSALLRRLNAGLLRVQLRVLLRHFGLNDPAYVLTLPTAVDVVRGLDPRAVVYNRSDKLSAFPEVDRGAIEGMEARLLREADAVLYVSHSLMAEDAAGWVGSGGFFLDHGVDLELFTRVSPPEELAAVPGRGSGGSGRWTTTPSTSTCSSAWPSSSRRRPWCWSGRPPVACRT